MRHQWIFSGAIESIDLDEEGGIAKVLDSHGALLGHAYFNTRSDITGRMVSFKDADPLEAIMKKVREAADLRKTLFDTKQTNAFRVINGEGDGLPGFVADLYGSILVVQVGTLGMEKLKDSLIEQLKEIFPITCVFEKSTAPARKKEGLTPKEEALFGELPKECEILENGLSYIVNIREGQKTGFFLDHREMRLKVRSLSKNRRVLNCFSYTGGFTVSALAGGACLADSVDASKMAVATAERNVNLNGLKAEGSRFLKADAFDFLKLDPLDYDLVILDPPAFAKSRGEVKGALRGYREINREAMRKMPDGSLLLTASCSYYVNAPLFEQTVLQAALDAGRDVRIVGRHIQAPDHPVNLYHEESDYLKSLLLVLH
ncbi:Conserved hypothetical protein [Estrella lausannensis]|uniref:Ribosomal RNA large subunit methyltransferase I n=2 Tax=Estrella lausannensis TaxID=483423 RepID=A0A0H5DPX9_9BACT|nr:Conserved hypothetical protein [Estrella lausannensis]